MHSYAQTNDFQCPVCGQPFRAEVWLIVDAGERPDLVERARAGDLHAVACPDCGPLGTANAPLLLYFPDHDPATGQPPLIFTPPQQSSAEQDQVLAGGLLGELAQRLGDAWREAWLAQVLTVPRALLPAALSDDPAAALRAVQDGLPQRGTAGESGSEGEGDLPPAIAAVLMEIAATLAAEGVAIDSPDALERALAERPDLQARLDAAFRQVADDVMAADDLPGSFGASGKVDDAPDSPRDDPDAADLPAILNRFLAAETWDESQRIVEAHPELLGDEADERFALALEEYADNPDAVQMLATHRALLRRCREAGIARAFAEQMLGADGLAEAERLGLAPEEFLAQMSAAQQQAAAEQGGAAMEIPPAVQPLISELGRLTQRTDMPQRIELCRRALALIDRSANPQLWAAFHVELANSYAQNLQGDRAANIERAIEGYEQALQVRTRQAMPVDWAQTQMNLAIAYRNRIRGNKAENIERAIEGFEQALQVRTHQAMPVEWAQTLMNLANAYLTRIQGDKAANVEHALERYEQALQVVTRQAMPVDWATIQMNLANAYRDRIRGGKADNIERAIEGYQQALQVRSRQAMPVDWAEATMNLATALVSRIYGDKATNIERAIEGYEQALQVMTRQAMPVDWALIQMNLATAYRNRIRGDKAANIERALEGYQQALQVRTRQAMSVEWAEATMNLANAYFHRIRGNKATNIERAIEGYEQALQVTTYQAMPVEWATTQMNLANAHFHRIYGERTENIERAIEGYRQVLQVRTYQAMPVEWAQTVHNLANTYRNRISGDKAANIECAIEGFEQALQVMSRQAMPVEWAQIQMNLATAYSVRIRGDKAANIERAIEGYEQALQVRTRQAMAADYLAAQRALACVAFEQSRFDQSMTYAQEALSVAEELYEASPTPDARRSVLENVAGAPHWLAYARCRGNGSEGRQQAVTVLEQYRARWLREALETSIDRPDGVSEALWSDFQGQARTVRELEAEMRLPDQTPGRRSFTQLSELLEAARRDQLQTVDAIRAAAPDFLPQPSFNQIRAAAQSGPLVYLLATEAGGLALVVHGESASNHLPGSSGASGKVRDNVEALWLDNLTEARVREWLAGPPDDSALGGWLGAYQAWLNQRTPAAHAHWLATMDGVLHALWDAAMGPLAAALARAGVARGAPVTLIPSGLLALLPLHAAWTADAAALPESWRETAHVVTDRIYGIDCFALAYAPSATALRHAQTVANQKPSFSEKLGFLADTLLAVDEPQPVRAGPLPNSAPEVAAIGDLFATRTVLRNTAATRSAALAALPAAQVAHFSCHGGTNWNDALASGLLMAGDETLTVGDLLDKRLPGARLATLSACETGIVGTKLPDESVALPAALLQAGFAGVAASLWAVADMSTAMLMVRFYELWREEGLAPPAALCAAQRWVRDTTNDEKANHFQRHFEPAGIKMADTVAAGFLSAALLAGAGDDRSFAHPMWWAAFYYTGV